MGTTNGANEGIFTQTAEHCVNPRESLEFFRERLNNTLPRVRDGAANAGIDVADFTALRAVLRGIPAKRFYTRLGTDLPVNQLRGMTSVIREPSQHYVRLTAGVLALEKNPDVVRAWWLELRAIYYVAISWHFATV